MNYLSFVYDGTFVVVDEETGNKASVVPAEGNEIKLSFFDYWVAQWELGKFGLKAVGDDCSRTGMKLVKLGAVKCYSCESWYMPKSGDLEVASDGHYDPTDWECPECSSNDVVEVGE